jgi:thioredoxin-like negative regulator of GroEL
MVVDCEKEPDMADKFNIEGYPTVKLAFKNQVVEYDANVKYDTLVQFVNTTLGESQ